MSGRHHNCIERASGITLRTATVAGTGVAGLAALFAATPLAHATPAPTAAQEQPAATGSSETTTEASPTTAAVPMKADYGTQKYRVGVRVKDGADVPADTTTAGTELSIRTTDRDGNYTTTTCTTVDATPGDQADATYCPGDHAFGRPTSSQKRSLARLHVDVTTQPGAFFDGYYVAGAGDTVTITQKTVNDNLAIDPGAVTISPCTVASDDPTSARVAANLKLPDRPCLTDAGEGSLPKSTEAIFDDPGLPPVAGDDSATTEQDQAVTIAIASNDTPKAKITSVKIVADPKHGTARLVTADAMDPSPSSSASSSASSSSSSTGSEPTLIVQARRPAGSRTLASVTSYRAVYTPRAGFVGTDNFTYTIATANGTATAKATVNVTGSGTEPTDATTSASKTIDAASDSRGTDADGVASTGTPSGELVGYAAALLAAGGGALALGRQRRRGRHAR